MNLKILFMIVVYYAVLSLFFVFGSAQMSGFTGNLPELNGTNMSSAEIDTGGLFGTGVSFARFFGLITIGIGLPSDTPSWFVIMFMMWQSIVTIFTVGFIISSIWNG